MIKNKLKDSVNVGLNNQTTPPECVDSAKPLVYIMVDLGLEKLSLLFNDEAQAMVILENCKLFLSKYEEKSWDIPKDISESLASLLLVLDKDRLKLLHEGEEFIELFENRFDLFYAAFDKPQMTKRGLKTKNSKKHYDVYFDILMGLIEELDKLSSKWSDYRHISRNQSFSTGVEDGLYHASGKVNELIKLVRDRVEQVIKEEENNNN